MQGAATKAMPGCIGEERRRRRRPRAAATACGGWPFARDAFQEKSVLLREIFFASRVAKGQTRHPHPFFSSLLDWRHMPLRAEATASAEGEAAAARENVARYGEAGGVGDPGAGGPAPGPPAPFRAGATPVQG